MIVASVFPMIGVKLRYALFLGLFLVTGIVLGQFYQLRNNSLPPERKAVVEIGDYSRFLSQENDVVLYSLSTCPLCERIKLVMDEWGVDYEEREIGSGGDFLDEARELNARSVPVLLFGRYKIEGYDEDLTFDLLRQEGLSN